MSDNFRGAGDDFRGASPQFPCCHLLATGIKVSKQYWYWL